MKFHFGEVKNPMNITTSTDGYLKSMMRDYAVEISIMKIM